MKKTLLMSALLALFVVGCGKNDMPAACTEYFAQVEACAKKVGSSADAFKQAMEQSKAAFSKLTAEQVEAAAKSCKQASEAFKQSAAALKC